MSLGLCLAQSKANIMDSYNAETAGNYQRALEIMQLMLANDSNDEFFQLRIGWLQYLLGQYNEALKAYQLSQKISPNLDAVVGIVNCHLALGRWNDAISTANENLKTYPQHTSLMAKAAYASYMKQDYKVAADFYAKIIRITPWDMEVRGYLVNNLYLAKDINTAKNHYLKLKKYYPDSLIVKEYAKVFE